MSEKKIEKRYVEEKGVPKTFWIKATVVPIGNREVVRVHTETDLLTLPELIAKECPDLRERICKILNHYLGDEDTPDLEWDLEADAIISLLKGGE